MYEGPQQEEADRQTWSKTPRRETWDLRLHLRLAQNYTIAQQYKEAIEQYLLRRSSRHSTRSSCTVWPRSISTSRMLTLRGGQSITS